MQSNTSSSKKTLPGYPIIEKLIETEDFSQVDQTMSVSYEALQRLLKQRTGGMKAQRQVRQAVKAFDLTLDLMKILLKTKYEMIEKIEKQKQASGQSMQKKL